jgi:hypothetical protein
MICVQLVGGSIYLYRINRGLAAVTVLGIGLIGALTTLHGEFIRRMGKRSQVQYTYSGMSSCSFVTNSLILWPGCLGTCQLRGRSDLVPGPRRPVPWRRRDRAQAVRLEPTAGRTPHSCRTSRCMLGRYGNELRRTINMLEASRAAVIKARWYHDTSMSLIRHTTWDTPSTGGWSGFFRRSYRSVAYMPRVVGPTAVAQDTLPSAPCCRPA